MRNSVELLRWSDLSSWIALGIALSQHMEAIGGRCGCAKRQNRHTMVLMSMCRPCLRQSRPRQERESQAAKPKSTATKGKSTSDSTLEARHKTKAQRRKARRSQSNGQQQCSRGSRGKRALTTSRPTDPQAETAVELSIDITPRNDGSAEDRREDSIAEWLQSCWSP